MTTMIDAHEESNIMTIDAPNAFAQASLKREKGKARVIMKIAGVSVEQPVKKAPHTHEGFAVLKHRQKVMHLNTLKTT